MAVGSGLGGAEALPLLELRQPLVVGVVRVAPLVAALLSEARRIA